MAEEISIRDQRTEVTGDDELTEQEVVMLQSYADGKSMITIGYEQSVGAQTIRSRFSRINEKLDAANSTHAVAIGIRRGIID